MSYLQILSSFYRWRSWDPEVSLQRQPWIFIGRTDAEAPTLWPPDVKIQLIGKDPDAGKGWGQEEKGTTEDEMIGWHHWLNGHECGQTLGDSEGQGSLTCWASWGSKESDTTEWTTMTTHVSEKKVLGSEPRRSGSRAEMQWDIIQRLGAGGGGKP